MASIAILGRKQVARPSVVTQSTECTAHRAGELTCDQYAHVRLLNRNARISFRADGHALRTYAALRLACVTAADGWLSSDIPGRDGRNRAQALAAYLRSVQIENAPVSTRGKHAPRRERQARGEESFRDFLGGDEALKVFGQAKSAGIRDPYVFVRLRAIQEPRALSALVALRTKAPANVV